MADSEGSPDERTTPVEAFQLFSHELRVAILLELWDADGHALGYADLKDRVGERDSGKFNYHLSKLVDHFVTHADEEYELSYAGHRVIDAIKSGVLHQQGSIDDVPLDAPCPHCGESLAFAYVGQHGSVRCSDCERSVLEYPFDPGGLADRSPDAVVAAFDRRTKHFWRFALSGVCPVCAGIVDPKLTESTTAPCQSPIRAERRHYAAAHPAVIALECAQCSFYSYLPVGVALLSHPAVVGFLYDHGIDVRRIRLWELEFVVDPSRVAVASTDPRTVDVTIDADHERLIVRLDEDLDARSFERIPTTRDDTV